MVVFKDITFSPQKSKFNIRRCGSMAEKFIRNVQVDECEAYHPCSALTNREGDRREALVVGSSLIPCCLVPKMQRFGLCPLAVPKILCSLFTSQNFDRCATKLHKSFFRFTQKTHSSVVAPLPRKTQSAKLKVISYELLCKNKLNSSQKVDGGPTSLRREGDHLFICCLLG